MVAQIELMNITHNTFVMPVTNLVKNVMAQPMIPALLAQLLLSYFNVIKNKF
jgi:hypothetical protein